MLRSLFDDELPISFRCYDGSVAGPRNPLATVEVRSPQAIGHVLHAPGQLGLARAYVTGAIEVQGDLHAVLHALVTHRRADLAAVEWRRLLRGVDRRMLRRPPVPVEEAPAAWRRGLRRHTRRRDTVAIAHHYDVSNRFYELVLGSSMAYSCAVFKTAEQDRRDDARCGPGGEVRPDLPKARAASRAAAPRHWSGLGRLGPACGCALRGQRARRHALATAGAVGPAC